MKITHLYDDLIYVDVQYHDKTGLMKLEELRMVVPDA